LCRGLAPTGGGAGVGAWMLEALRHDHDVTVLTERPPELVEVDRAFGTRLAEGGFAVEVAPAPAFPILPLALWRQHHLFRAARNRAGRYDVVISNENETWLGRRCIQYVHFPWGYQPRPPIEMSWYHRVPGALALYRGAACAYSGFRADLARTNLTLANSAWTAARLRDWYGIEDALVVPPPIVGTGAPPPWSQRRSGFVMLGRMSREKRIETVVEVLARVRAAGEPVTLELVGFPGAGSYQERLRSSLAAESWITRHEALPRSAVSSLLLANRYGIHAMVDEHFGMAVAEMVRAGCVVFAHASGGPQEILIDPRVLFHDEQDAAVKILATLRSDAQQRELGRHLAARAEAYSAERFCATLRSLVAAWPQ
jgi:glycosyltransferase involved in cell wall biosynthesis